MLAVPFTAVNPTDALGLAPVAVDTAVPRIVSVPLTFVFPPQRNVDVPVIPELNVCNAVQVTEEAAVTNPGFTNDNVLSADKSPPPERTPVVFTALVWSTTAVPAWLIVPVELNVPPLKSAPVDELIENELEADKVFPFKKKAKFPSVYTPSVEVPSPALVVSPAVQSPVAATRFLFASKRAHLEAVELLTVI